MEDIKICPRCNSEYTGFPALSRVDNETYICSSCGVEEAHLQYFEQESFKQKK